MHIVLLPGMDGTGLLFADFVSALGPEFESTVVQYPADRELRYAELESIARSSLPRDRPFLIMGESFSGPIAISLAASRPSGLAGLVLCCTFARNPRPMLRSLKPFISLVPFHLIPSVFLIPMLFGRFSTGPLRSEHHNAMARVSNVTLRARMRATVEIDVSAQLQHIAVPILYLRASEDRLVPKAASEHIQRIAPHVQIVELEAPHLLLQAIPSTAATIVGEFSRRLEGVEHS